MIDMSPQSSSLLRISLLSIVLMTALAWLPRLKVAAPAQSAQTAQNLIRVEPSVSSNPRPASGE